MKLSVVINTKNAAATLEQTLKSVKFADEIVVVDMKSTDDTVKIAKKYTDRIYDHKDVGYVEPARNYAIKKAKGDWILIVDADEEIPQKLRKVIEGILQADEAHESEADCFYIPRKNLIFGKAIEQTGWWPDYVLRLFRKGYVTWSDEIHSIPITKGEVHELAPVQDVAIVHHNYQHVDQFITRLNRYTKIQAKDLSQQDIEISGPEIIERFYSEFLSRYFAQKGVNDGTHGISLSLLQGLSEAVVAIKAWENAGFPESNGYGEESSIMQLEQMQKELAYWIADWQVNNSKGIKRLIWRIRRKLYI